ncbi:MAG: metallophosphoesterase [Thermosipho sp. (in: Bacteria)]|nr:metallophosphoesterase [Thermosipho sp. (in: thermotogales)]
MKKIVSLLLVILSLFLFSNTVFMKVENEIVVKNYEKNFEFKFPEETQNFFVAVYGDSRWGNRIHKKIVQKIQEYSPLAVVHLGDMVNRGDVFDEWQTFFEITEPLRQISYFQVVKGNHEKPDIYFRKYFGVYNYYSDFGDWRFIYLDLETGIEKAISFLNQYHNSKTIVFMHFPVFTVGPYCENKFVLSLKKLHEVFKNNNIKLVFSAHEHNYQRFFVDGVVYVISGGAGAFLYGKKCENEHLIKFCKEHNFVILHFVENKIDIKAFSETGELLDEFIVSY